MQEDNEERRRQDRRDLEFFQSRIRPTCSDLWRLADKRSDINMLGVHSPDDESMWPLLASALVFLLLAWNGALGRAASLLP